jgi:hypothetical protein
MEVMTAMEAEPTRWNDGRLDEFATNVDKRFNGVDRQLERVNDRLDDLIKVLIAGIIAFTGAVLAGFASIVVLIATQI